MSSFPSAPSASIVVPTKLRPRYLEVALASIAPQAADAGAELVVVDDAGPMAVTSELAARYGALYEPHDRPRGLNVARNTGVEHTTGELVVFVDDDVEVSPGWLRALLRAAEEHPEVDVFTGPILPRLEGSPPRTCGREGPPITSLDLGPEDAPTTYAWGANMAIRRVALERVGPFDVELVDGGDEQEWQERLAPAQVLYVAAASLDHRREPADASLLALCKAAFARGKAARRFDAWRREAPSPLRELLTLAGCFGHVLRHSCPAGLVTVAHSSGRVVQALCHPRSRSTRARAVGASFEDRHPSSGGPDPAHARRSTEDFLSGESGTVGGIDGVLRAGGDLLTDTIEVASGRRRRLDRAARYTPPTRRVLVLGIERPQYYKLTQGIRAELARSRHQVELSLAAPGDQGKFENLNLLLQSHQADDHDWLLLVDDDIVLPRGFLDRFLLLAERFSFDMAQPAHRHASHAAWRVTRRQPQSLARETQFVEIGPVTAFARSTFLGLLPFPNLRMGWGLDLHWAALAREQGWRQGVIDAVAIGHRAAPAANAYSREQALAEARSFLAERPYLSAEEAQRTLTTYKRL